MRTAAAGAALMALPNSLKDPRFTRTREKNEKSKLHEWDLVCGNADLVFTTLHGFG